MTQGRNDPPTVAETTHPQKLAKMTQGQNEREPRKIGLIPSLRTCLYML